MTIKVKLFSVLRQHVNGYDPDHGIDIEMGTTALVSDVIHFLKIPTDQFPVVSCGGRILQQSDPLIDGTTLHIFQPVAGG